jgi:tetratricopeptide (TPR) repeat protein
MIEIPAPLVERLKSRQAVLVAGLGCSELTGAPGWDELALRLCEWIEDEGRRSELKAVIASGRLAAAIAYLGARLGRDVIVEVLKDAYPPLAETPEVLSAIARIPWRGVISTGFDGLWAAAAGDAQPDTSVFLPAEASGLAEQRGRFLLQLAGSTRAPDSLSLGPVEGRARLATAAVGAPLQALAAQRCFVFVGFRPRDPDLAMVVQQLGGAVAGGRHFIFLPGLAGLEAELVEAELGLTVVRYEGALDEALRELEAAWRGVAAEARPSEDDVDAWLEILSRDPADPEPRAVLARAEARLVEERRWDRLAELLLGRVELEPDRPAQAATLREVARLYESELDAPERGFAALTTALRLDPDAHGLLADAERSAGKAGLWGELAAEYAEVCAELPDGPAATRHRLELGRIYAEELDRVGDAIVAYQAVLDRDPTNAAAVQALADLLAKDERWDELVPVLARAAELETSSAKAIELRLQLAELQETRGGDVEGAIATYERVRAAAGADRASRAGSEALNALERLYRKRERWPELARTLEAKAAREEDPAAAARLRRERADLLAERLGDTEASIRELEAVLEHDRDNRAALRALEKLYERLNRDDDQLRTLERLADLAESDAERLLLLRRLAAAWEARPDGLDRAADALEHILNIDARDIDAFRALARVYRQAKRWLALAEALGRQMEAEEAPTEKRELAASLGEVYERELRDDARAAAAYATAAALGDDREATLSALARLDEQAGRWAPAVDALEKLARTAKEPAARTEALVRAATITADRLDDRAAAEGRFVRALEADPGHVGALSALAALYRRQGDNLRAAKLMREAEARTANRIEKVRLCHELGVLLQDGLDDPAQATELFERALDVDPEHVASAERLVPLYTRAERWSALLPLLEMLARKAGRPAAGETPGGEGPAALHLQLAETARRLGDAERAARAYEAAQELAPRSAAVLRGFGGLRFERGEWREAVALYRGLLAGAGADAEKAALPPAELVDVYGRLGRCETALENRDAALGWYEKALALDAGHRPSLEAIAALHAEKGDFGALVLDKRTLLGLAADDDTRVRLSEEIGDLYLEKLSNAAQAITAYQTVLALAPTRRQTFHKLLELYTAERRWRDAAGMLVRLADLEEAPAVRAKYLYAAAVIHRDELSDGDGAVALFNRALDDAPDLTKAFDAVERLLAEAGAWKELARNYRRMIKRLPAEGMSDLRLRLWSGLGEVSFSHLGDVEMAATALEVASSLDRSNVQRHEQLAEVYVQAGADHYDKAIAEHQWLIAHNPDRLASYRALAKLYAETGAHDKLWCVAATLSFLRKADPELAQFYEDHRPRELRTAKRAFTDETWQKVAHPDEDRFIAAIFMLLGQFVATAAAQPHQTLGLRRKERVDVASDERVPTRILRYVADTLELSPPDLFFKESEAASLSLYNLVEKGTLTPTFVIGKGIEQRVSEAELVFEMGKRMAFLRPERYLRCAIPSAPALDITLRAALSLAGSSIGHGSHNGEVDKLHGELRRMVPKSVAEQLAVVGRKLVSARGEVIDVQAWIAATDLTAGRVGFALTSDLPAAARVISTEPAASSPLPAKQRLKDLLAFSVSEEYFSVRKFLGLDLM